MLAKAPSMHDIICRIIAVCMVGFVSKVNRFIHSVTAAQKQQQVVYVNETFLTGIMRSFEPRLLRLRTIVLLTAIPHFIPRRSFLFV